MSEREAAGRDMSATEAHSEYAAAVHDLEAAEEAMAEKVEAAEREGFAAEVG